MLATHNMPNLNISVQYIAENADPKFVSTHAAHPLPYHCDHKILWRSKSQGILSLAVDTSVMENRSRVNGEALCTHWPSACSRVAVRRFEDLTRGIGKLDNTTDIKKMLLFIHARTPWRITIVKECAKWGAKSRLMQFQNSLSTHKRYGIVSTSDKNGTPWWSSGSKWYDDDVSWDGMFV